MAEPKNDLLPIPIFPAQCVHSFAPFQVRLSGLLDLSQGAIARGQLPEPRRIRREDRGLVEAGTFPGMSFCAGTSAAKSSATSAAYHPCG